MKKYIVGIFLVCLMNSSISHAQYTNFVTLESLRSGTCPSDDTGLLVCAAALGHHVLDGEGNTYFIDTSGPTPNIELADWTILKNLTINYELHEANDIRVLHKSSGSLANGRGEHLQLHNVRITLADLPSGDRAKRAGVGSIADSAAIWIAKTDHVRMEDVEVAGDLKGSGIFIGFSNDVDIIRPYIHHMRFYTKLEPDDEQLVGIFLTGGSDVWLHNPRIEYLSGVVGSNEQEYFQTDGISATGVVGLDITEPRIGFVGEGIDLTGSVAVDGFSVRDGYIWDVDSFCYKFANHTKNGDVIGNTAVRCGYAGFVVGGPASGDLGPGPDNIRFYNNQAYAPGGNPRWAGENQRAGFTVMQSHEHDPLIPATNIRFEACSTYGAGGLMNYGFFNEVIYPQVTSNRIYNIDSFDHIIEGESGFNYGPIYP